MQTKLFLLLQTDQYAAALSLTESSKDQAYEYERVYSLYRLQREVEATDILKEIRKRNEDDRGVSHLEAQLVSELLSLKAQPDSNQFFISRATDRVHIRMHLICTINCWTRRNRQVDDTQTETSRNLLFKQHSDEQADILTNLEAAQKHLDFVNTGFLHALDALPASVTKDLENNPPPAQPTSSVAISEAPAGAAEISTKPAPKAVRKKRVPKGVTPGVTPPPDPERWLKKSERSTTFQVGKRRKAGGGGGATQGASVEVSSPAPSQAGKAGGKAKRKK